MTLLKFETQAAIFPPGKYTWVLAKKTVTFTKGTKGYKIAKDTKIGIRPATSKKGVFRIVSEDLGVNIVFTVSSADIDKITGANAKPSALKVRPDSKVTFKTKAPKLGKLPMAKVEVDVNVKAFVAYCVGPKFAAKPKWNDDTVDAIRDRVQDLFDPVSAYVASNSVYLENWKSLVAWSTATRSFFKLKVTPGYLYRGLTLPKKTPDHHQFALSSKKPSSWTDDLKIAQRFADSVDGHTDGFVVATNGFKADDVVFASSFGRAIKKAKGDIKKQLTALATTKGMPRIDVRGFVDYVYEDVINAISDGEEEVTLKPGAYKVLLIERFNDDDE